MPALGAGHGDALRAGGIPGSALYGIYYAMPRLDWAFSVRQFLVFGNPLPAMPVFCGAMLFYAAYTALLLVGSWLLFRRKALN